MSSAVRATVFALAVPLAACTAPPQASEVADPASLAEVVRPTVVSIHRSDSPELPAHTQVTTGLLVSADGYILSTVQIADREKAALSVRLADGRELPARLVGADSHSTVSVLKIDATGLPASRIAGLDRLAVGEQVLCVTVAVEEEPLLAVWGSVRALKVALAYRPLVPFIETDVGNVDGPLFNARGEAIGLNSIVQRNAPERAFAIPIDLAMWVQEQLRQRGRVRRGRLGLVLQELTPEAATAKGLAAPAGALINDVEKKSPADRAGLKAGDILLQIDGKPVERSAHAVWLLAALTPGVPVSVRIWRDGAYETLRATPGELVQARPQ